MYFQVDMCCLCLNRSTEKLHHLNDTGVATDVSYYEKIKLSLSNLDFKHEYAEDYMLCVKCCSIIDNIYEFNDSSIRNIDIMTHYMTLLSSPSNQRCKLVVELSDWSNALIDNKECIKLEDTITSKVTDAIVHNTVPRCETMQDNFDMILHWSDDAYVSTVEMINDVKVEYNEINVNKVVDEACVDDIDIKEELDIKIEEPEVVADYLKHAYELSNINNAHTYNRDCIKLEDSTTDVTDVMVHEDVPVSDPLQINNDILLHQPDDDFILFGGLVNDVAVEYNDSKEGEACIETEEYADNTPGDVEDLINAAEDTSSHGPILSEENFSISNPNECNTLPDLSECKLPGIDKGVYKCDICNRKLSNRYVLMRHRKSHKGEKRYMCDVCNKGFIYKYELVKHKRLHTGEKPYVCEVCHKRFIHSRNLAVHKRVHSGERSYLCEVCNKRFIQNNHLIKHKRMHTGEKPYVCEVCDKGFTERRNLVSHKRMHTGEKPYVCEVCDKRFTQSSHLFVHKRVHSGERPYVCEVCNKRFMQNSDLVKHKRMHTGEKPYVCEVCDKGFAERRNLVNHKQMHTGKKPYVCEVCDKGYTERRSLVIHKRMHTGEKPYVCEVCDKRFTAKRSLVNHKRNAQC